MIPNRSLALIAVTGGALAATCPDTTAAADRDARRYVEAIESVNERHAQRPGDTTETDLANRLSGSARAALDRVLRDDASEEKTAALVACGEAALDLALAEDFASVRAQLLEESPEAAVALGEAVVRDRFVVRTIGAFEPGYADAFADIVDGVLDAFATVFGFTEWSKVPGKKVRVRVHLEDRITRPPHFAPQFPFHSEIDLPVTDAAAFRSPTDQGHMMFYGLCHEFGHLVAMWGDRRTMEDHHAWAHYTGVTIVEHMASDPRFADLLAGLKDVGWRSLTKEKEDREGPPSLDDKAGVMSLLIALHDLVGPAAIGQALNRMDETGVARRVNHVRYYHFADLEKALTAVAPDKREAIGDVMP